jgi:hypothetical protein
MGTDEQTPSILAMDYADCRRSHDRSHGTCRRKYQITQPSRGGPPGFLNGYSWHVPRNPHGFMRSAKLLVRLQAILMFP